MRIELSLAALLLPVLLFAQENVKIKGRIVNEQGEAVEYVQIGLPKRQIGTISTVDGRFEMDFVPIMDRAANTDFIILGSNQHQVFGRFSGKAILDDGRIIEIKDFLGFAEKVANKW